MLVGDGVNWVWTLADEVCHGAVQILDYPHAAQHASDAAQAIFGTGTGLDKLFVATIERMLWEGRIEDIVPELEACAFIARGHAGEALVGLVRYDRTNAPRMRYERYRALEIAAPARALAAGGDIACAVESAEGGVCCCWGDESSWAIGRASRGGGYAAPAPIEW